VKLRLLCLDERALTLPHYIVGMFETGVPNEVRYSLISVCNEF
jgi:hypothetical protein